MARFSPLDNRFDRFLYASVLECDGLPVSVLTVLTRQNLDPREEAARLAGLPRGEAVDSLAAMISHSSNVVSQATASEIASQLVERLPATTSEGSLPHGSQDPVSLWLAFGIFLFMMALSANTNPQSKSDLADHTNAVVVRDSAKVPSDTRVLMQPRN